MSQLKSSKTDTKVWVFAVLFVLLIAISSFLLFYKLDVHYMHYYDEHFYGLNAYEMIENSDYIVHTYMGELNVNNVLPPLGLWVIALSYKIFGFSLFSMRAQSAIAMLLSQVILGLWTRKRYGNLAGIVALAMLIGTQLIYGFHFARFGDLDALYQLFFMLSMLCMIDSGRDFRRLYGSAIFCGLAYLTKSWHAVAIAVTCLSYLLITGRVKELKLRRILLLIASFLAVVLPWAVARMARDGLLLFEQSIFVRVAGTFTITDETATHDLNVFGYFRFLLRQVHFSGALLISAFCALVLWIKRRRSSEKLTEKPDWNGILGCLTWIFATPVLLMIIEKKLDWYVFSSLYGSALLTGVMVQALYRNGTRLWTRIAALTMVAALLVFGTVTSYLEIEKIENDEHYRTMMADVLDREFDSGLHAYVQYNEQKEGEYITEWTPTDTLYAKLYGNVVCLPGGVDAFLADHEDAVIFIGRANNIENIGELYLESICLVDDYYVCAFSN
ncbi:MAG: glycosyltransferase family 39 protein [Bacillota bacterium]